MEENKRLLSLLCYHDPMVAIRFKSAEERANGFMLLARNGGARTLRGEIYVCSESALRVLESHNILYEKVPLPVSLDEMDALRDTPTTAL